MSAPDSWSGYVQLLIYLNAADPHVMSVQLSFKSAVGGQAGEGIYFHRLGNGTKSSVQRLDHGAGLARSIAGLI